MITPTVGRVVHFYDEAGNGPMAAIVSYVHSDTMINITAFSANGEPRGITSVPLVQPEHETQPGGFYCVWMPYQVKKSTGSESGEKEAGTQTI